jgi:hypothetical protein
MAFPRTVTATEVLAERAAMRAVDPGHNGSGFYGFMPACHCPGCRDHFDPTGEHVAAYLNCQPSYFDRNAYLPEFGESKLRTYSFYNARSPGIYVQGPASAAMIFPCPVNAVLSTPPAPHILNIPSPEVEDHYYLNPTGNYSRFTYVKGALFIYKDGDKEVSPEKVLSKMTVLNLEKEEQDFIPLDSGGGSRRCDGCEQGHLNQLGHMGPGGCLEERYEAYCHLCNDLVDGVTDSEFTVDESIHFCAKCVAAKCLAAK